MAKYKMYKCKRFYGRYSISEHGTVYSHISRRILSPEITQHGYFQYTISTEPGVAIRIRAHQMVASLFVHNPNPDKYGIVNHIDGDKKNTHYTNLEWTDHYGNNKHARDTKLNDVSKSNSDRWKDDDFRKRTSANISKGLKENGTFANEKNPRYRYRITMDGYPATRQDLVKILGISQSYTDALIKRAANFESIPIFEEFSVVIEDLGLKKVNRLSKAKN